VRGGSDSPRASFSQQDHTGAREWCLGTPEDFARTGAYLYAIAQGPIRRLSGRVVRVRA